MGEVTADFVTFDDDRDACLLIMVEQNWTGPVDDNLRALQSRFYGCLNAVLDGDLAEKFPASKGRVIILRVDCYDLPVDPISDFVERFEVGIGRMPDYSAEASPFVRAFGFEVHHDTLVPDPPTRGKG